MFRCNVRMVSLVLTAVMVLVGCGGGPPASHKGAAQQGAAQQAASGSPTVPAQKDKVRVGYSSVTASQVIPLVAKEAGIFDKYGIDAEIVFVAGSSKLTQAVVAGDIPFAVMGGQSMAEANVAGADTVMVAGTVYTLLFYLMTTPDIKMPEDLKGKKIGITRFGSAMHFAVRYALKHWNIPEQEVGIVQLNDTPSILAGMKSGAVDAGIMDSPSNVKAAAEGFRQLIFLADLGLQYQQTGAITTRRQIEKNPDLVQRFVQAYAEGLHRFKTDKAFALKMIGKLANTDNTEMLEQTYAVYEPLMAKIPHPSVPGMQTILDELGERQPKAKVVKPQALMEDKFVQTLETAGFFKQLWGN